MTVALAWDTLKSAAAIRVADNLKRGMVPSRVSACLPLRFATAAHCRCTNETHAEERQRDGFRNGRNDSRSTNSKVQHVHFSFMIKEKRLIVERHFGNWHGVGKADEKR